MTDHIPADDAVANPDHEGPVNAIAPDIASQRLAIVNVVYVGTPQSAPGGDWVLVDAGVPATARSILNAVAERFGEDARPASIVLTHGHFDHVGVLESLATTWDVPIYAHEDEMAYLTGERSYPPPDPGVGGGMMALLSRFYPRGPIDVSTWVEPLPADGTVPGMPGWEWLHTPGHTRGHVSLWRERDRSLIAGDAFVTTDQESVYSVATQKPELQGPPMYFTPDWAAARASVELLAALEPERLVTGHGPALEGEEMRSALHRLARDFDEIAVPEHGKYVDGTTEAG